jgi:aminopeptidase-like protein
VDIKAARAFIQAHYRKNRTTVSADIPSILHGVEATTGLPVIRHRFPSGGEYATWIVPPQWDVREAWVKDANGKVLASYADHPLFVAPYSKPIRKIVSGTELRAHLFSNPQQPDAFAYNHRLAHNAKLRLADWCLSLPQNLIVCLGEGPFEVCIDAEVKNGEMLVGEIVLEGMSRDTIAFLADWCHPGQVNDSFSGLVMFMEVMRTLAKRLRRRYTYKLLIFPETVGSSVYIGSDPTQVRSIRGAIFSEMVGWGEEWYLKTTRTGHTYMDLLAADCRRRFPELKPAPFFSLYGNDEHVFDSVQVGIPTLSLQKFPYAEYHTSNDHPSRLNDADLVRAYEIILHLVDVAERDAVYEFVHPVPFYMSRFDLYADAVYEQETHRRRRDIQLRLAGKASLLKIAGDLDMSFQAVHEYVERMSTFDLVRPAKVSPWEQG